MPEIAKTKPDPKLGPTAFYLAEFKRNAFCGLVEKGVRPEDVLNPAYWAYHAAKLKPWDRIELRAEDGTWFGEYLVLGCDRTWARVFPLRVSMLTASDVAETQAAIANTPKTADQGSGADLYEIKFRGPKKWSVVRKSDNAVMAEGMMQDEAKEWLKNHLSGKPQTVPA